MKEFLDDLNDLLRDTWAIHHADICAEITTELRYQRKAAGLRDAYHTKRLAFIKKWGPK